MITTSYGQNRKSKIREKAPSLIIEKFYSSIGATTDINKLKGKIIILDFWGSWCGPCIKYFSHMNDLVMEFKDQAVQFITIGYEDTEKAKKILDKHNVLSWKAIDSDLSVFEDYEAWAIPLVIIIDKKGIIIEEIHPKYLTKELIQSAVDGKKIQESGYVVPYFNSKKTKEYFLKVVKN